MAKKNHLINVRLTDSQISFLNDLTSDCFDSVSDSIRFAIDLLNVITSEGVYIDLSERPEMVDKLQHTNLEVEELETL